MHLHTSCLKQNNKWHRGIWCQTTAARYYGAGIIKLTLQWTNTYSFSLYVVVDIGNFCCICFESVISWPHDLTYNFTHQMPPYFAALPFILTSLVGRIVSLSSHCFIMQPNGSSYWRHIRLGGTECRSRCPVIFGRSRPNPSWDICPADFVSHERTTRPAIYCKRKRVSLNKKPTN